MQVVSDPFVFCTTLFAYVVDQLFIIRFFDNNGEIFGRSRSMILKNNSNCSLISSIVWDGWKKDFRFENSFYSPPSETHMINIKRPREEVALKFSVKKHEFCIKRSSVDLFDIRCCFHQFTQKLMFYTDFIDILF